MFISPNIFEHIATMLQMRSKICLLFSSSVVSLLLIYIFSGYVLQTGSPGRSLTRESKESMAQLPLKRTNVIQQNVCAVVNITHSMEIPGVDCYRVHLTCTVLTNNKTDPADVVFHWSGVGLKSMWVDQSPVSQQGNKYKRRLTFRPWLDVHAGKYTCHVMMKDTECRVEKSITLRSDYRGLVNSRRSTGNLTHGLPKASAWFSKGLCGEESVWKDYAAFHHSVLTGQQQGKYLLYDCTGGVCGGYGNRMHGITTLLMFAMLTKRVLLIQMSKPVDINLYLLPNAIQWNYRPPAGLKNKSFDLRRPEKFYPNYRSFEATLSDHNSMYDLIIVQLYFGLYYNLVIMNDYLLSKMMTTFQLKTEYDCVMMYGCTFNYLFKYQPETIKSIEAMQSKLGLEARKFVSLHIRTHINDNSVFNPLRLEFPWQPMFECALKAAKSLSHKMKISKVPIFLATDHQVVIDYAQEFYRNDVIISWAPEFHIDWASYSGPDAFSQYDDGVIGVLSDIEISSRAAVFVRSADSTMSELIGAIHFISPQHNLHPFYFYEKPSICEK